MAGQVFRREGAEIMKYRQYTFTFYLNTSHAIYINGNRGQTHPHTWEITLHLLYMQENFIEFHKLEERTEQYMAKYQDICLNDISPFDKINPTLENCCEHFKNELKDILNEEGWLLLMIEIKETPTRAYVINLLDEEGTENEQFLEAFSNEILTHIASGKRRDE